MKLKTRIKNIAFFNLKLLRFGYSSKAVGWSEDSALSRYKFISQILIKNAYSEIVDYGCGLGGFSRYIRFIEKRDDILIYHYEINMTANLINCLIDGQNPKNKYIYSSRKLKKVSPNKCFVAIGIFNVGYDEKQVLEELFYLFDKLKIHEIIFTILDLDVKNKNNLSFVKSLDNKIIIEELRKSFEVEIFPKYLLHDLTIRVGRKS